AYVTDTTASKDAAYLEHIHGVDLLIHECYFADGWESQAALTGHSCLTPVAQLARAADVKRLVLVHINPMLDQEHPLDLELVRDVFPAIEVGADGQVIEF
ncbi:MAG: metal-dependent hydrolase, partial [Planctomycetales bacterium]|nr:metal-dependent hydrolase [Planctomycetales bacterium]